MFEQTVIDAVVILGMFALRVAVPVIVLFGLAAFVERKLRPQETREPHRHTRDAKIIPLIRSPRANSQTYPQPGDGSIVKQVNAR